MASALHFGGYYRGILRNVLPSIRRLRSAQCARVAAQRLPRAPLALASSRCFATESAQKRFDQDQEPGADGSPARRLDRALYRLDMDVRRTGRISLKDVKDIFTEIKILGNPSNTQCLLLIRCCGSLLPEELSEARSKLVDDIWMTLEAQGVALDVSHYNAILKVHLENEHQFSPTDFLSNMEAKGIVPNRVTYQRLIAHYCQKGDIAGASKILEFMKDKDLPINENVFNALIQGHARANDMTNAKSILEVMRNAKLDPGPTAYTQLLSGYAEKGDVEGIKEVMNEMKKEDIQLLDRDYMVVISALANNGFAQHVDELISQMHRSYGYNQDVVNTILQLVNRGQDDTAYKLLLTMSRSTNASGDPTPVGQFFIRHLVKMRRPKEKILQLCNDLKQRGLNTVGILRATEASMVFGHSDYAVHFLESLKAQDSPIRPHYFWPILISHGKSSNEKGVYDTIRLMTEMGAQANFDTFLEYIYPSLSLQDPVAVVQNLKDCGYSVGAIVGPMVSYLVTQKELQTAVHLCKTYAVRLTPNSLTHPLALAYQETGDLPNTLQILLKINANLEPNNKIDWTGHFLLEFMKLNESDFKGFQTLLEGLKSKSLGISRQTSDLLHRRFKQQPPKEISALLEELQSTSLDVSLLDFEASGLLTHPRDMSVQELENHLIELKAKDMNTRGIMRRLLLEHCRLRNLTRALEIKKELDEMDFIYSPAMCTQLMSLYASHDDLKEALRYKNLAFQTDPEFVIDDYKILNLATAMVKQDLLEDAIKLITDHYEKYGVRQKVDSLVNNNWRLLNATADKGDVAGVKRLFELLLKCGFLTPVNMILGSLVKVHLVKEDLEGALATFEHCCKTYQSTPWKNELFVRLIKLEDAERLQKVVDLSTDIHGEMNTMYDLAFAFLDGDQFRQAKKIFETPGFRARANRLESVCERYLEDNRVTHLEQLVSITRDIFDIDRDNMYYQLIRAYAKNGDTAKALGVWTTMQEESVHPSDRTLSFLGKFLEKNGQPVPFAIPEEKAVKSEESEKSTESLMRNSTADEAMNLKRRLEGEGRQLSVAENSSLMGTLLFDGRVLDALAIAKELHQRGERPQLSKNRLLLQRLALDGDIENVNYVSNSMNEEGKRRIGYGNMKATAYINAGRHLELLEALEAGCPDNYEDFPRSAIVTLLNKHPDLLERVEKLVKRYADVNIHTPLNFVWQYYFINGHDAKADEIYKSTPRFQEKLLFLDIVREARIKSDEKVLLKLRDLVKPSLNAPRVKGILYSALIDVTCANGNLDAGLKLYNEAIELGLRHRDFNQTALDGLKRRLTDAGKPVPFEVSQSQTNSSTSSSDSDSESSDDDPKQ